jgi:uncharacterized GH25 family protein/thiol-disulfide isomerase/thioredoxin
MPGTTADDKPAASLQSDSGRTMRVLVQDPEGRPLSGATVGVRIWREGETRRFQRDYPTDVAGSVLVEVPRTCSSFSLFAGKRPLVTLSATWSQKDLDNIEKFPVNYTFRLESGVTAGGRVVNEQGHPISGAKVEVGIIQAPKPLQSDGRLRYCAWLADENLGIAENKPAKTDAAGRWRIDMVPDHLDAELQLDVSHPGYISTQANRITSGITTMMLRAGEATVTLKRGVIVHGRVIDPEGRPIKGALLMPGWTSSECMTAADGRFRSPPLSPRRTTLTVIAPGWAPQNRQVDLQAGPLQQDFHMQSGKPLRVAIVDAAGKPVASAGVRITMEKAQTPLNDHDPRLGDTKIPCQADENGIWEWSWAPRESVKLEISSKGFAPSVLEVAAGESSRTIVLKTEHRITGQVLDAKTGKPIPSFAIRPIGVIRKDILCAERDVKLTDKEGRFDYLATRTDCPHKLRIESVGYRSQDGPEFRIGDASPRSQNFRLQPSPPIGGTVVDGTGRPVANADVLLATPSLQVTFRGFGSPFPAERDRPRTKPDGRFAFPDPGEPIGLLAWTDEGFALAEFPADHHDAGMLRLQPWASVRGRFRDGGRPVPGATIFLDPVRCDGLDRPRMDLRLQTVTGPDGSFDFPRVAPIPVSVWVDLGPWKEEGFRSGPRVPLDLKPGQRAELEFGGAGTVVNGKVRLTGKLPANLDCSFSLNYLVRREPGIPLPADLAGLGFDDRKGWNENWTKSAEGRAYLRSIQHWFMKLAADGSFRASGVPAGDYELAIAIYGKPTGCLLEPLARRVVRVNVTEEDVKRGELTVQEVDVPVAPVPIVGDAPELAFECPDGKGGTLRECRGRYSVVHFWASWCGPCKLQLPGLRQLTEQSAGLGLHTLSLSLDEDSAAWRAALRRLNLPWQQGRLTNDSDAGVSSVPAYWLLDPSGKIIAKCHDPDEVAAQVAQHLK